ncbi:MAG: hypothetical protein QM813_01275 [Verrucomicrobiota bacterium]
MTKLFTLFALAASLLTTDAANFAAVHASMTWTPVHSITNQTGTVRQARTAPASKTFGTHGARTRPRCVPLDIPPVLPQTAGRPSIS